MRKECQKIRDCGSETRSPATGVFSRDRLTFISHENPGLTAFPRRLLFRRARLDKHQLTRRRLRPASISHLEVSFRISECPFTMGK